MKNLALFGILAVAGIATTASAYETRVRFVEQTGPGNQFTVLDGNTIDATDGLARRIRVQFGVFDDAAGAAPAGGVVGWNVGSITVNGDAANSAESRTPGRLSPFNFVPGGNGVPPTDPFDAIVDIDNVIGTQSPFWGFDPPGLPAPLPTIRGLNSWISTYEITIDPADGGDTYTIDFAGNVIAALEWRVVGEPIPPDPDSGTPGAILYAPFAAPPVPFASTLTVVVPAPGAAALLGLGGLVAIRRRR